jgi:hypothetical protein
MRNGVDAARPAVTSHSSGARLERRIARDTAIVTGTVGINTRKSTNTSAFTALVIARNT